MEKRLSFRIPDPKEQFDCWTNIPNFFIDRLMPLMPPITWKVLCFFVRKLYGFQKGSDHISITQIEQGCNISHVSAVEHTNRLMKAGIIIQVTPHSYIKGRCREYGMNTGKWCNF